MRRVISLLRVIICFFVFGGASIFYKIATNGLALIGKALRCYTARNPMREVMDEQSRAILDQFVHF